ncbi:hypothetical protein AKO1_005956 [Acrasis kona]|uniref:Uncharacterized protein n=1 Tax=Acrasis kona TaxID=1008807 RepID=A0AAW2YJH8_9EUKA
MIHILLGMILVLAHPCYMYSEYISKSTTLVADSTVCNFAVKEEFLLDMQGSKTFTRTLPYNMTSSLGPRTGFILGNISATVAIETMSVTFDNTKLNMTVTFINQTNIVNITMYYTLRYPVFVSGDLQRIFITHSQQGITKMSYVRTVFTLPTSFAKIDANKIYTNELGSTTVRTPTYIVVEQLNVTTNNIVSLTFPNLETCYQPSLNQNQRLTIILCSTLIPSAVVIPIIVWGTFLAYKKRFGISKIKWLNK